MTMAGGDNPAIYNGDQVFVGIKQIQDYAIATVEGATDDKNVRVIQIRENLIKTSTLSRLRMYGTTNILQWWKLHGDVECHEIICIETEECLGFGVDYFIHKVQYTDLIDSKMEQDVIHVMQGITNAIEFYHQKGLYNGSLSSSSFNVFKSPSGQTSVKLMLTAQKSRAKSHSDKLNLEDILEELRLLLPTIEQKGVELLLPLPALDDTKIPNLSNIDASPPLNYCVWFDSSKYVYTFYKNDHRYNVMATIQDSVTQVESTLTLIPNIYCGHDHNKNLIHNSNILLNWNHPNLSNIIKITRTHFPSDVLRRAKLRDASYTTCNLIEWLQLDENADVHDMICIESELCDGSPLSDWIRENKFTDLEQELHTIMEGIVYSMAFIHKRDIFHGSLSGQSFILRATDNFVRTVKLHISLGHATHYPGITSDLSNVKILLKDLEPFVMNWLKICNDEKTKSIWYDIGASFESDELLLFIIKALRRLADPIGSTWYQNWQFVHCLGSGAFGTVFSALQKNTRKQVAVKLIPPRQFLTDSSYTFSEESRTSNYKKMREFENMKNLSHKNVAKLYSLKLKMLDDTNIKLFTDGLDNLASGSDFLQNIGSIKNNEIICIEMELCGPSLRNWLDDSNRQSFQNSLEITQVNIVFGIISGMRYLHDQDIIHRDLNPNNIFLGYNAICPVKIGDFGLSKLVNDPTLPSQSGTAGYLNNEMTTNVGTKLYQAPEILTANYNTSSDIFSMGLVIWEVLQLIKKTERNTLFTKLVFHKDTSVVDTWREGSNMKEIVLSMSQLDVTQRVKNLWDINPTFEIVQIPNCITYVGNEMQVSNGDELTKCLNMCQDGTRIKLLDGIYDCNMLSITKNEISLVGNGNDTILQNTITAGLILILGDKCSISNLKIIGCKDFCVRIHGSHCRVTNVDIQYEASFSSESFVESWTFLILGDGYNLLRDISIHNKSTCRDVHGILMHDSCHNNISHAVIENVAMSIVSSYGTGHNIEEVVLQDPHNISRYALLLVGCSIVSVKHVECNMSLCGKLIVKDSRQCVVEKSKFNSVKLKTFMSVCDDNTLLGVDCGELLQLCSQEACTLTNCTGQQLKIYTGPQSDNVPLEGLSNKFESVTILIKSELKIGGQHKNAVVHKNSCKGGNIEPIKKKIYLWYRIGMPTLRGKRYPLQDELVRDYVAWNNKSQRGKLTTKIIEA
ncbi:uncharacterized protein LOC118433215 isoform X2 [Folsomia candida]|uniref:uncharacterized protein LOC118433215 isoform X2 n=1 Tax=Folsomia candida TaxID=158441 RepID=UPI0016052FB5|nr:uncharacterized protein LOC118433215 isoform X2 [Folsomia candida]